jgi:hypothetical protein
MTEISTADLAGGGTTAQTAADDAQTEQRERDVRTASSPAYRSESVPTPSERTGPVDAGEADGSTPLFPADEGDGFRSRWQDVQTGFVDEPRSAVEQADGLVAEMMQRLAGVFSDERAKLEEQWSRSDDISTEDLRQALRRYRSFFDRLLSV